MIIYARISRNIVKRVAPIVFDTALAIEASVSAGSKVTFKYDYGDGSGEQASASHIYSSTGALAATVTAFNAISQVQATIEVQVGIPVSLKELGKVTTFAVDLFAGTGLSVSIDVGSGGLDEKLLPGVVFHSTEYASVGTYKCEVTITNSVSSIKAFTDVNVDIPISEILLDDNAPLDPNRIGYKLKVTDCRYPICSSFFL